MRNQITRLRYMVLWVKIGVLTPWTFHPFSNLVCYLVALKGSVVYPLSPNFFGCLVLSNFSCHVLLSVRKLAGEVTSSQDASWLWIQNYCNPRFFFSGVLIMISVFFHGHQIVEYIQTSLVNRVLVGETSENRMGDTYRSLPSMAIEIGEHSCFEEKRMESVFLLLAKLVFFFGFSAIWHLNGGVGPDGAQLFVTLFPSGAVHRWPWWIWGHGFAMKLLVAWKTWCNTWVFCKYM